MRTAIQTIEAIGACVVWVDEMEKAFAGVSATGDNDSGVTKRVFGDFITWMQEKKGASFIVATSNQIRGLPPELMRKGRFDEIFFVALPDDEEREEIFKIHINKYRKGAKISSYKELVKQSKAFSGAEIAESIISAMYSAFHEKTEKGITDEAIDDRFEFYIMKALSDTTPLSKSRKEQLEGMTSWAQENAMDASKRKTSSKESARQLDLDN